MTREEALRRVKRYLTDIIPAEDYSEVEEILKALEQQPCDDTISRKELYKQINSWNSNGEYSYTNATYYLMKRIRDIPSIAPQQKIGYWIDTFGGCKCSECDCLEAGYSDYCPNCGVKMEKAEDEISE